MSNPIVLVNTVTKFVESTHKTTKNAIKKQKELDERLRKYGGRLFSKIAINEGYKKGQYLTPSQIENLDLKEWK